MEFNWGWALAFAIVVGIPIAGILSGTFTSWLKYRYRRAALDTLKAYAANGREPPQALIDALTPQHHRPPDWGAKPWTSDGPLGRGSEDDDDDEGVAEFNRGKARMRAWARARHHRRSPEHAWRQAIFWGALTTGFGLSANYIATGDAHDSLTIVAIIMGALTVAATLSAILTTVARASDRKAD